MPSKSLAIPVTTGKLALVPRIPSPPAPTELMPTTRLMGSRGVWVGLAVRLKLGVAEGLLVGEPLTVMVWLKVGLMLGVAEDVEVTVHVGVEVRVNVGVMVELEDTVTL